MPATHTPASDPLLAALELTGERVEFPPGQTIFVEGEPGDRLYRIESGKVKLGRRAAHGRERLLALLGPSDTFGELSIFDPGHRTTTATTVTEVAVVSMHRSGIRQWIAQYPALAEYMLQEMARRLRRVDAMLVEQAYVDAPGRMAEALLRLAMRFGIHEGGHLRVTLDLTQDEVAQLIGTTRETANKTLAGFARRGWLRWEGKTVLILDAAGLARRARPAH